MANTKSKSGIDPVTRDTEAKSMLRIDVARFNGTVSNVMIHDEKDNILNILISSNVKLTIREV